VVTANLEEHAAAIMKELDAVNVRIQLQNYTASKPCDLKLTIYSAL
jgi:hypothetical protein